MDFQPVNLFIRGALLGPVMRLSEPITMYKYLNRRYHQSIIADPTRAGGLSRPIYVTMYCYYDPGEALRSLAIPGPMPTHVLELDLQPGTLLQGPAFVNPVGPRNVAFLPTEHRYGNGIEFVIRDRLASCLARPGRVVALRAGGGP